MTNLSPDSDWFERVFLLYGRLELLLLGDSFDLGRHLDDFAFPLFFLGLLEDCLVVLELVEDRVVYFFVSVLEPELLAKTAVASAPSAELLLILLGLKLLLGLLTLKFSLLFLVKLLAHVTECSALFSCLAIEFSD